MSSGRVAEIRANALGVCRVLFRFHIAFARGCFYPKRSRWAHYGANEKTTQVRFFTADGVEVETILDLAGPHKDELVKRIVEALARDGIFSPSVV